MKDSIKKFIGQNIKKLREAHGITPLEMATELGYTQSNYGKIEKGKVQIHCQELIAICKFFHCNPEQILFGETQTTNQQLPDYFAGYSELEKRRILRMFYLLYNCQSKEANTAFHRFYGSDLLNRIPVGEENVLPYVLEYERKLKNLPKTKMIEFLGISKNRYYSLISGTPLSSIDVLLMLQKKLEYDLSFLLYNKVNPEQFLSVISPSWNARQQMLFGEQLNMYSAMDRLSGQFDSAQEDGRTCFFRAIFTEMVYDRFM